MATAAERDGTHPAPTVVVTEWRRYGHHRAYVVTTEGAKLGFRCLATGLDHPVVPEDAGVLATAVDAWSAGEQVVTAPLSPLPPLTTVPPLTPVPPPAPDGHAAAPPWTDLALNLPGARASAQARAHREAAPGRAAVGRLLGVHSQERAWRVGAKGEQLVAAQIAKVARADPRWRVLHAVPVGTGDTDIDHVVIGPGGVFTLNAKHHAGKRMWVGGDTVMVDGRRVPYVRNARHEARRAARLLSVATGSEVTVTGVVVPVKLLELIVRTDLGDVAVVPRNGLVRWMRQRPAVLSERQIEHLHELARRSTTWRR